MNYEGRTAAIMDSSQPTSRPEVCPDCGAAFSGEGTYCWLCGWKLSDPLTAYAKHHGPTKENPYASPALRKRGDLEWTLSLSTLFLWVALVAVVMGVAWIALPLGIALGILCFPAALHTTAIVASRKRRSGQRVSVQDKIVAFTESFVLFTLIAVAIVIAAIGALFVVCMSSNSGMFRNANFTIPIIAAVAGLIFIGFVVFFLVRALWKIKD
jgi:hypothetical protein